MPVEEDLLTSIRLSLVILGVIRLAYAQPVPTSAVEARPAGYGAHSSKREQDREKKFRACFKNQIYAPGAYTRYGAKPIAAVREYMDQEKWKEASAQVPMLDPVLKKAAGAPGQ